jgi:hypothetical protein
VSERDPVRPDTDDLEVNEADAIEQSTAAVDSESDDAPEEPQDAQDQADPADLAEQARTVRVDDDEYR